MGHELWFRKVAVDFINGDAGSRWEVVPDYRFGTPREIGQLVDQLRGREIDA